MFRRAGIAVAAVLVIGGGAAWAQRPEAPTIEVYKTSTCGCCKVWVEHLRSNGFTVRATDVDDLSGIKAKHGVPARVQSCHTGVVNGYVVEGHVPAADIQRLLKERPKVAGLAVAGMPIGSPGMEGANPQVYNVLAFDKAGKTTIFSTQRP